MERIKVHDKYFKLYMSNQQIEESIQRVADKLNSDLKDVDTPVFLSVLTGSFMFTASLMQKINFQCDIAFIKLASYEGTETTGNVKQIMGLTSNVEGRTVVVVEDIVDSGRTLSYLLELLEQRGPKSLSLCTLLDKPERRVIDVKVDYTGFQIPDEFVVGYGLDYDQRYRNLPYIGVVELD